MSVEKHLANARKYYSRSRFADAIYEYRKALEIDPRNQEAIEALNALTDQPVPAGGEYEPGAGSGLKTNFLAHQAEEKNVPITRSAPVMVLLIVIGAGMLYGLYQAVMYYLNYDKLVAMKYVEVRLQKPVQKDGAAYVNVEIENLNPVAIKDTKFKYDIFSADGSSLAAGEVQLPIVVPPGESRTVAQVKLGAVSGTAARLHPALTDLHLGPKPSLSADLANKFIEACAMKPEESAQAFTDIVKASPEFGPAYVKLGESLAATGDTEHAVMAFGKAIKIDADDANAHYHLGVTYFYKGDKEAARKELTEAARLAPDDPVIASSLSQLGEPVKAEAKK